MSCGRTESWQKVLQLHGKVTGVDRISNSRTERFWRAHEHKKLMEFDRRSADAQKVDGSFCRCTESWQKLTEGLAAAWNFQECFADAQKVYIRSCGCTKSWRNVPQMHSKLTEVDGKTSSSAESLWKTSLNFLHCCWTFRELRRTISSSNLTVFPKDAKEVDGSSHEWTKSWFKLVVGPAAVWKVDRMSRGCMDCWWKQTEGDCRTIHQLFERLWGLLPTSAHLSCGCGFFRVIPSTFHSCAGHSVIIPCNRGTFHPIPSTSVKIMCLWELLITFCVASGPFVNFRQPSVRQRENLLTIFASAGTSV